MVGRGHRGVLCNRDRDGPPLDGARCTDGRGLWPAGGDILNMHRGQRREDVMRIRPQKTRRRTNRVIEVPILPELAQMLDETPKEATVYVISEETGGPSKADNFRHLFAEIRTKAGIDE